MPEPFETLGSVAPGSGGFCHRFAAVPLPGRRAFFFATFPRGGGGGGCGGGGGGVDDTEVRQDPAAALRRVFSDSYHEPIPAMVEAAAAKSPDALLVEELPALPDVSLLASGRRGGGGDLAWDSGLRGRGFALGDCIHGVPPNLAQGAAVAIEDAFELAAALGDSSALVEAARAFAGQGGGGPSPSLPRSELERAADVYSERRAPRVRRCALLSAFTAGLATMPMVPFREAMRFVPGPLNSAIFDAALETSLGGRSYRTGVEV